MRIWLMLHMPIYSILFNFSDENTETVVTKGKFDLLFWFMEAWEQVLASN